MRELKHYVACTVDGFIARAAGSFDFFLSEGEHLSGLFAEFPETAPAHLRNALGVQGPNRCFDAALMGRRTYEVGLHVGVTNPYLHLKEYVFSRILKQSFDASVTLISGDPAGFVHKLKHEPGQDIWLCGGELAAALLPEIDELILKVNPVLLGSGIPLFAGRVRQTDLKLVDSKVYRNGLVLLRYRLVH